MRAAARARDAALAAWARHGCSRSPWRLALAEYARGHVLTGLPWNLIGYGLTASLPVMQLAALVGVYVLSLLAVLLFASPFAIWAPSSSALRAATRPCCSRWCCSLAYLAGFVWGDRRLAAADLATTDIRLRIVQANVDQANKWRPENSLEIFEDYLALTRTGGGAPGLAGITLVIWPETAVPFLLGDTAEALERIAETLPEGTSLLAGSPRVDEERDAAGALLLRRVYNSLFVVDDRGTIRATYDKIHLVPFGEYLPFQDFMEKSRLPTDDRRARRLQRGQGPRLISVPGAPRASPLICYEIIFPGDVTDKERRPGWLLNLTNDAWFGTSAGPYQHFHQAQVRAVEEGLPVVRAANTGISAIIDSHGRDSRRAWPRQGGRRRWAVAGRPRADTVCTLGKSRRDFPCSRLSVLCWLAFSQNIKSRRESALRKT